MNRAQIKRLPFVVSTLQSVYQYKGKCKSCGVPWCECDTVNVDLDENMSVFYVCSYCFEHSSLEEVLKATCAGYTDQLSSIDKHADKQDFIKKYNLIDILMKTQEKYLEIHKQIENKPIKDKPIVKLHSVSLEKPPFYLLNSYDEKILNLIAEVLKEMADGLLCWGPTPGKEPERGDPYTSYEPDPGYKFHYDSVRDSLDDVKKSPTVENIEDLYLALIEYDFDYVDAFYKCRYHLFFKNFCPNAYDMAYGGELDDKLTRLIRDPNLDWTELDTIVYTYLVYKGK